jgi:hypothetical protein
MADFCKQCSIDIFGEDLGDLAGITTEQDEREGKAALVICEGCGAIQVDRDGKCISADCIKKGHTK